MSARANRGKGSNALAYLRHNAPAEICALQRSSVWTKALVLVCTTKGHTSQAHRADLEAKGFGPSSGKRYIEFLRDEWPTIEAQILTLPNEEREAAVRAVCDLKLEFGGSLTSPVGFERMRTAIAERGGPPLFNQQKDEAPEPEGPAPEPEKEGSAASTVADPAAGMSSAAEGGAPLSFKERLKRMKEGSR